MRFRLVLDDLADRWMAAVGMCEDEVISTPPRRGIVTGVTAELEGAGPLGLVTWLRRVVLALSAPMEVGPVPAPVTLDPLRIVHWPATARWGQVIVKEMEDPAAPEFVIVVDLRGEPDRTEAAASGAAGLAGAALHAGWSVCLLTAEGEGPRAGRVESTVAARRRLARAVADAAPAQPAPDAAAVVRVTAA